MGTKATKGAAVLVLVACAIAYVVAWRGIVVRRARALGDPRYGSELCRVRSQPEPREPQRSWGDPAPGRHYRGHPQGRYLALTRDAARAYHTIFVWDEQQRSLRAVLSVQEMDPGSGMSHDYRWSEDGTALLIYGKGSVPFAWTPTELSYAYIPEAAALFALPKCGEQPVERVVNFRAVP